MKNQTMKNLDEYTPLNSISDKINVDVSISKDSYKNYIKYYLKLLAVIILIVFSFYYLVDFMLINNHNNGILKKQDLSKKGIKEKEQEPEQQQQQPNIVWIVGDDIGFSDINYNGAEYPTNTINSLASQGIILTQHYVQPYCSPTRAAFLTSRYPFRYGLQSYQDIVQAGKSTHVPETLPTIADVLKKYNYVNYAFGKWHLGYASYEYLPTSRGFDYYYGYLQSHLDSTYNKTTFSNGFNGYDWYENDNIITGIDTAKYSTYELLDVLDSKLNSYNDNNPLFLYLALQNPHEPLELPNDYDTSLCDNIKDDNRKLYCKSMQILDDSISYTIDLLKQYNKWDNTLLIFTSDNGALSNNGCVNKLSYGSNYPYRGQKLSLFEGGILSPSFISGPLIPAELRGTSNNILMHAVDWLPTLLNYATSGIELDDENSDSYTFDGYNLWDSIISTNANNADDDNEYINREDIPLNIDLYGEYNTAFRYKNYKYIKNIVLMDDDTVCDIYTPKPNSYPFTSTKNARNNMYYKQSEPNNNTFLFDLDSDPYEYNNLLDDIDNYNTYAEIITTIESKILEYIDSGYSVVQEDVMDPDGYCTNFNNYWMPWL